jgi:hypothetical protein
MRIELQANGGEPRETENADVVEPLVSILKTAQICPFSPSGEKVAARPDEGAWLCDLLKTEH